MAWNEQLDRKQRVYIYECILSYISMFFTDFTDLTISFIYHFSAYFKPKTLFRILYPTVCILVLARYSIIFTNPSAHNSMAYHLIRAIDKINSSATSSFSAPRTGY